MKQLVTVSLRHNAVFVPSPVQTNNSLSMTGTTAMLVANLAKLGFGLSEPLLRALNFCTPAYQSTVLETFREVAGADKNWTPLVKGWDIPTGESLTDHINTFFATLFSWKGTRLICGHIIPPNSFPLHRYNGCPYCGTPFETGKPELLKQSSKLRVLELWTMEDVHACFHNLLISKTALDATQMDSLKLLLSQLPLPPVSIPMKETLMAVIDIYVENEQPQKAQALFTSPSDVLRYLWYKKTGFLQIIEPRTIIDRHRKNNTGFSWSGNLQPRFGLSPELLLKLKYNRNQCLMVASWLNSMDLDTEKMCEIMHPKRGMWVRFIRALRLAEYSRRAGFEKLRTLLDKFYNNDYEVWQGHVDHYRLRHDVEKTLNLLKQRPGLFARSLFANILWFGSNAVIPAFTGIIDKVPARLLFTLYMYAEDYFDDGDRVVKPLGGISKRVPSNRLLRWYNASQREAMVKDVAELVKLAVQKRFAAVSTAAKTMYIDPALDNIPVSIGERSEHVQDLPAALPGMRFPVEGNTVRLFMQWGTGMPEQHLDMDLSCYIAYSKRFDICSFHNLVTIGCKHSGDIQSIPHMTGTAEYIELDVSMLKYAGATYVSFTCNAYTDGSITPNLVVGWMNSAHPMTISNDTGVAYDPSCVQHQVRVAKSLAKGMVFGVLDLEQNEIVWLEMPFDGKLAQNMDGDNIKPLLKKLSARITIGQLLRIKAEAQQLTLVPVPEADEIYTKKWAMDTAAVTKLLID